MRDARRSVALLVALAGCGNSGVFVAADGGNPIGLSGFAITATDPMRRGQIAGTLPGTGNEFIDVDVTLVNQTAMPPLLDTIANYSLKSASQLVFAASPLSEALTPACPTTVSVATGGMLSCRVAFETPIGTMPSEILYADGTGRTATAAVPAVPARTDCTTWTNGMTSACQTCLMQAGAAGGTCQSTGVMATMSCQLLLAQNCIDSSQRGCPQVKNGCTATPACDQALKAYGDCQVTACPQCR